MITELDTSRIAIIGPGRLGTSFAYKFGRDHKRVTIYYHDAAVCQEINKQHLNPRHLTQDLARKLGGMEHVPLLPPNVTATNNLERVVEDNDLILLCITMPRLPEFLNYLKPLLEKKAGDTCLISPIKGLMADEITKELITPSQLISSYLYNIRHKYHIACVGGPFFDVDIAMGNPICVTVAGKKKISALFREELIRYNRRELSVYYNVDIVGVEACGSLKNIVANIKGLTDSLMLGDSIPGTIFARSGVEIRSLSRLLGGSFQAFHSQAGVGDMYVTVSSEPARITGMVNYIMTCSQAIPLKPISRFWNGSTGLRKGQIPSAMSTSTWKKRTCTVPSFIAPTKFSMRETPGMTSGR
jgi:glycerol-3-phosphate dehydrogenase (NAD(P)+)